MFILTTGPNRKPATESGPTRWNTQSNVHGVSSTLWPGSVSALHAMQTQTAGPCLDTYPAVSPFKEPQYSSCAWSSLHSYLLCTSSLWNKPVIQAFLFQSVLLNFFYKCNPSLKVLLFIRVANCGHTRTQVSIVVIRPLALLVARFSLIVS